MRALNLDALCLDDGAVCSYHIDVSHAGTRKRLLCANHVTKVLLCDMSIGDGMYKYDARKDRMRGNHAALVSLDIHLDYFMFDMLDASWNTFHDSARR